MDINRKLLSRMESGLGPSHSDIGCGSDFVVLFLELFCVKHRIMGAVRKVDGRREGKRDKEKG